MVLYTPVSLFEGNRGRKLKECDALRDFVPFIHFKKREKHPWRNVTFSKIVTFHLILKKNISSS